MGGNAFTNAQRQPHGTQAGDRLIRPNDRGVSRRFTRLRQAGFGRGSPASVEDLTRTDERWKHDQGQQKADCCDPDECHRVSKSTLATRRAVRKHRHQGRHRAAESASFTVLHRKRADERRPTRPHEGKSCDEIRPQPRLTGHACECHAARHDRHSRASRTRVSGRINRTETFQSCSVYTLLIESSSQ
jgi:hypothetical protein